VLLQCRTYVQSWACLGFRSRVKIRRSRRWGEPTVHNWELCIMAGKRPFEVPAIPPAPSVDIAAALDNIGPGQPTGCTPGGRSCRIIAAKGYRRNQQTWRRLGTDGRLPTRLVPLSAPPVRLADSSLDHFRRRCLRSAPPYPRQTESADPQRSRTAGSGPRRHRPRGGGTDRRYR
jgi:hypothetical protein